jgi:Domain of unknown function (DUF4259)
MSIWGPGPFDNDDGADWFAELRDEPSLEKVREALQEVAHPEHFGYHDVADGAEAIAAAEVLAELLGSPGNEPVFTDEHEEVTKALREEIALEDRRDVKKLVQQAIDAVGIVLNDTENSELRQLWDEQADVMPDWSAAMTALQQRLQRIAGA